MSGSPTVGAAQFDRKWLVVIFSDILDQFLNTHTLQQAKQLTHIRFMNMRCDVQVEPQRVWTLSELADHSTFC